MTSGAPESSALRLLLQNQQPGRTGIQRDRSIRKRHASAEPFAVDGLDDKRYGLSVRSFYRYGNSCYDESPVAFINRLKLEYARNNLVYSNMTISEIAAKLGYSTIYFDRFFKRRTGKTPCCYRREMGGQIFSAGTRTAL